MALILAFVLAAGYSLAQITWLVAVGGSSDNTPISANPLVSSKTAAVGRFYGKEIAEWDLFGSFEAQKKANVARKKQKTFEIKEIKLRPNIDNHDYEVKMRAVTKFLGTGDKVKLTMRFRGREMAHQELGMALLKRVEAEMVEISKVEQLPKLEGRQMTMVIAPLGKS